MAIEGILEAIDAQCEATVAGIRAKAQQQADQILEDAGRRGEAVSTKRSIGKDAQADLAYARIVNGARLEAERRVRRAREDLYQEAHRRMLAGLQLVRSRPGYPELLARLISEAQAVLPDAATLVVDQRDQDLTRRVAEDLGIPLRVDATITTMGGAELVGDDGRRVSNTLDARAEKAAAPLRRLATEQVPELGRRR